MKLRLAVEAGAHQGLTFSIEQVGTYRIGRAGDADLALTKDTYASREHCLVELTPRGAWVRDVGSRSGTYVNGKQVHEAPLADGDTVLIGRTGLRVSLAGVAPSAAPIEHPVGVPGFTLVKRLPTDGLGQVWWASSELTDRLMILHVVSLEHATSNKEKQRFIREAGICARLHHPGLARFLTQGFTDDRLWFATEIIEGESLRKYVEKHGSLPVSEAVHMMCQALDVVAYLHQEDVVHRSLRPESVLVQRQSGAFTVHIADLASAKCFLSAELQQITTLSERGTSIHGFTAPEALTDFDKLDPRSDIYALGAMLYFILTGRDPYSVSESDDLVDMILNTALPPLHTLNPGLPHTIVRVVECAMAHDVGGRYHSVHEMRNALVEAAGGTNLPPDRPKAPEPILLTLRVMPQSQQAQIIWDAHEIGQHTSTFRPPYDSTTLRLVIKALDAIQYPTHPNQGPKFDPSEQDRLVELGFWKNDRVVADIDKRVGSTLYNALLAHEQARIALASARNAATAGGKPLAYLLRFPPEAIEIAMLPWELLWDAANPLMFSRGELASFVRYLDLDQALPPPAAPGTSLHVLAIAPNAGIPQDVRAAERTARDRAWSDLKQAGVVMLDELGPATVADLVDRIQNGPPIDILHFYGHGRYKDGQGELLFDTPDGNNTWVSANRLAALLGGKTRLIMLHACQSAMIGEEGLLTGVASALTAGGVPIVVAMQVTIQIQAATRFAGIVYKDLAHGESVQHAVSRARQALFVEAGAGTSWYVPTLTIRDRHTRPMRLV